MPDLFKQKPSQGGWKGLMEEISRERFRNTSESDPMGPDYAFGRL